MKNYKLILVLVMTAAFAVSCAQNKKQSPSAPAPITPPPFVQNGGSPGSHWEWGASATFSFVDPYTAMEYAGRPLNNPTDVKLNVRLEKRGQGYGGYIAVGYTDNGTYREGAFVNGDLMHFPATSLEKAASLNVWSSFPEGNGFHGIFQDYMGGMILVVDEFFSEGDGQPPSTGSGSLYFKNFGLSNAPQSPTHCFFVSLGPYDCRSWPTKYEMNTFQSLYPTNGYKKLGTFQNLDLTKAFGDDITFVVQ